MRFHTLLICTYIWLLLLCVGCIWERRMLNIWMLSRCSSGGLTSFSSSSLFFIKTHIEIAFFLFFFFGPPETESMAVCRRRNKGGGWRGVVGERETGEKLEIRITKTWQRRGERHLEEPTHRMKEDRRVFKKNQAVWFSVLFFSLLSSPSFFFFFFFFLCLHLLLRSYDTTTLAGLS